jgi:hypothetical protein
MALSKNKSKTLKTTVKDLSKFLAENKKEKKRITPRYAFDNNLVKRVEGIDKGVYLKIFKEYERGIKRRLLTGETYSISWERMRTQHRNSIVFRIKRSNKNTPSYRKLFNNNINFGCSAEDLLTTPTLRLVMETTFKTLNSQKLKSVKSKSLEINFKRIPVSERYKFPKE